MGPVITEIDLQVTKSSLKSVNFQKQISKKIFKDSPAINLNSFQRNSVITLKWSLCPK